MTFVNILKTVLSGFTMAILLTSLNACGIYKSRKLEYQNTGSIKTIELPSEDMADAPLQPLYDIPVVLEKSDEIFTLANSQDLLRPEAMSKDAQASVVKIQKVAKSQWILLEAPTAQIWPLVQSFLLRNDMGVINVQPREGLIETDWLLFNDDKTAYHRYQLLIEKGVRDNTSEVHILQDQTPASKTVNAMPWPSTSINIQRQKWMIDALSKSLADDISNKAASLLGQVVGGEDRVKFQLLDSEPTLRIRLSINRAMASLSRSATKEGFISWQDKASEGLFYVGYNDPQKRKAWLTFGLGKKRMPKKSPIELNTLLAHLADSHSVKSVFGDIEGFATGDALPRAQGFLLKLTQKDSYYVLRIRNVRGEPIDFGEAKRLLMTLKRNMI